MASNSSTQKECVLQCADVKHLYTFPQNKDGRQVWLRLLGLKYAKASANVCDRHFSDKMKAVGVGTKLLQWAIPDMNLPEPADLSESDEEVSEAENNDKNEPQMNGSSKDIHNDIHKNSPENDDPIDFDDLLAQVHHIPNAKPTNNNEKEQSNHFVDVALSPVESPPAEYLDEEAIIEEDDDEIEKTISAPPSPIQINSQFKRKLIALVKRRRLLYDPAHPSFANIEKRKRAWDRIGKIQKLDASACQQMWVNMRCDYQAFIRKLRPWLAGESPELARPRLPFENDLLFLSEFIPDVSFDDDCHPKKHHTRSSLCHLSGVPDLSAYSSREITVQVNNYARTADHPYANNNTDESIQFACRLIEEVKYYPQLYDLMHPNYGEAKRKSIIWEAISNELGEKTTKCLLTWIQLQLRYEFELANKKNSFLVLKMDFLEKHILPNERSPFKRTALLSTEWYEPMNVPQEQHQLLQTIVSMKKYRPFFMNFDPCAPVNKEIQAPCWKAVARSLRRKPEQCEVTWIVMQEMYCELSSLRENDSPLRDEWEFESVISNLRDSITKNVVPKPIKNKSTKNLQTSSPVDQEYPMELENEAEPSASVTMEPPAPTNEITFQIPGLAPGDPQRLVRFNLNVAVKDLPEKSIVEIDSVLENAHIVIYARPDKTPLVYVFTLEKRKELIAEVMARPILFNEPCKSSRLSRVYWGEVSKDMKYPAEILTYFWDYIMEKQYYLDYDPSYKKSEGVKWIPPPMPIFDRFIKYTESKHWNEFMHVLPDFVQEIGNFPIIYTDLKVNSSWNRRQSHSRDMTEVWSILSRKFAVIENLRVIWEKLKQIFLVYMSEIELSMYNPWPKNFCPVFEKMRFLVDLRYSPNYPIYHVIQNKIKEEIEEYRRDIRPTLSNLNPVVNAKAIFGWLKENQYLDEFRWVNHARFVAKMRTFPVLYDVSDQMFGNKDAKLDAWQEMALSFHCTVGECHLIFQHLMKGFLLFRARDPNQVCRVSAKYWENMTYIYSRAVPNSIDPKILEGRSFRESPIYSPIKLAEEYQGEISLVDAKSKLILKNFNSAVNSLPAQIQASVVQQINNIFNEEETTIKTDEIVVDI